MGSLHLRPTAELAPRALLPGDPGRALALAQLLLDAPRMFNHARGLWGYTGAAADGAPLTIQSTGLGAPSAAVVLEALCALGLERAVRVGTARAVPGAGARPGDVLHVGGALLPDGTRAEPAAEFAGDVVVASTDRVGAPAPPGVVATDLTTGGFLAVAAELGLRAGALLAVVDGPGVLDEDGLLAAEHALGRAGAALLGLPERVS